MKKKNNKLIPVVIACLVIFLAVSAVMNIEVSISQGVNGRLREISMPLYVKIVEFLARHYEYQRIAKEITADCHTDEEKAITLLAWTQENIRPLPAGMPVVDDHILNIIIRGYGDVEQSQDVFTTLCAYSGIPSFYGKIYAKGRKIRYPLSFVKINEKWRVFDSYNKKYFRTKTGDIASVEDIIADRAIIENSDIANRSYRGVPYKEFYYNLKPITEGKTLRPEKQMLLKRAIFEIKKAFGIEKEDLTGAKIVREDGEDQKKLL